MHYTSLILFSPPPSQSTTTTSLSNGIFRCRARPLRTASSIGITCFLDVEGPTAIRYARSIGHAARPGTLRPSPAKAALIFDDADLWSYFIYASFTAILLLSPYYLPHSQAFAHIRLAIYYGYHAFSIWCAQAITSLSLSLSCRAVLAKQPPRAQQFHTFIYNSRHDGAIFLCWDFSLLLYDSQSLLARYIFATL